MRNIHNCRMWFPEVQTTLDCSYPERKKCRLAYVYIRPEEGKMKLWFQLCTYRMAEIGLSSCVKEKESLKGLKEKKVWEQLQYEGTPI